MVAAISVGVTNQKRRPIAAPRPFRKSCCRSKDRAHVLSIHGFCPDSKCAGASRDLACGGLGKMRVLRVKIVFADVDDGQFPKLCEIHTLIQDALAKRALAEKTNCDLSRLQRLR